MREQRKRGSVDDDRRYGLLLTHLCWCCRCCGSWRCRCCSCCWSGLRWQRLLLLLRLGWMLLLLLSRLGLSCPVAHLLLEHADLLEYR